VAEVAGDACLRFDPLDRDAMARCMARLADEPALREQLGEAGRARAAHFSWEETARRTLEAYEAAL
jgi:glycosyltransferase involved in cell wall biosynthesis